MYVISIGICLSFKRIDIEIETNTKSVNLLKIPEFTKLILPNLFRGIATGILSLATVIGIKSGILNLTTSTLVATLSVLGGLLGNYLYLLLNRYKSASWILLLCSIIMTVSIPMIGVMKNLYIFYVCYFISWMLNTTYGIAIPVMVYNKISPNIVGKYSAWRMLIFTLGSAIPGFVLNYLMDKIGTFFVLLICGILFLICAVGYIIFLKNDKNDLRKSFNKEISK